jgi:predicted dehydrogenase
MNLAGESVPAVRFGTLGAAKITPLALLSPARLVPGATVNAVAARDPQLARKFAARHSIPIVYESYEALLDSTEVDAIYLPLPNSLHCEWTKRALAAGKHVLCEKPLAANAQEAREMEAAAQANDRVLCEAFHYRYHPLAARIKQIVTSGQLGQIQEMEAHLNTNVLNPRDIRFSFPLGGGALMDTGSYTVNLLRYLAGAEPRVVSARARCLTPQIDRWMEAELEFPGGVSARLTCSILSSIIFRWLVIVRGSEATMRVINPIRPYRRHRITITRGKVSRQETVPGNGTTFKYQLEAFVAAVTGRGPIQTPAADAVRNLEVIDQIYRVAGLRPRGTENCPGSG